MQNRAVVKQVEEAVANKTFELEIRKVIIEKDIVFNIAKFFVLVWILLQ